MAATALALKPTRCKGPPAAGSSALRKQPEACSEAASAWAASSGVDLFDDPAGSVLRWFSP
ncbi:MAG: hypothetical protein DI562_00260 [Stenotrophomonas acidaminiphila]|nr:MAG: hypothetical protein DI562_00260 [Stenotrophomonas acidaminiphila]